MRIGSLFSGVGALDLAALDLFPGASMAWHAEINAAPAKVLAHHWPDIPNLGDVSQVDWTHVEPVDVLTGGFPCQDVSLAGKRAGLTDGTRSGLWSVMVEAIEVMRPRFVLIENVKGLLSARAVRGMESGSRGVGDGGGGFVLRALGAVLGDLSELGFDAEWACVRASSVGAAHRRERVFILAWPADAYHTGSQGPQSAGRHDMPAGSNRADGHVTTLLPTPQVADVTGGHKHRSGARSNELLLPGVAEAYAMGSLLPTPRASDGTKGGPNQRGSAGDPMLPSAVVQLLPTPRTTDAHGAGMHGNGGMDLRTAATQSPWGKYQAAIHRQELASRPAPEPTELGAKGNPRLSAVFAEWLMFWPAGWVTDPVIGLSRNDQLRIIGNGVVPPQAVFAFQRLLDAAAEEVPA